MGQLKSKNQGNKALLQDCNISPIDVLPDDVFFIIFSMLSLHQRIKAGRYLERKKFVFLQSNWVVSVSHHEQANETKFSE